MRLLCDASETGLCESYFYNLVAAVSPVRSPACFFADHNQLSGESCLLTEVIEFGNDGVLPLRHRVRDAPSMDEQRIFIHEGCALHAQFPAQASDGSPSAVLVGAPRFEETHRRAWSLMQMIARLGLRKTVSRTVGGTALLNERFMTWRTPPALIGKEAELIGDMPRIHRWLCADLPM